LFKLFAIIFCCFLCLQYVRTRLSGKKKYHAVGAFP